MKWNFWRILGVGLGTSLVTSLIVTTVCHNGKKIKKAFKKDESNKIESTEQN